jgi:hypothetical protein
MQNLINNLRAGQQELARWKGVSSSINLSTSSL